MPAAERLGARSRCWVAPVGTELGDSGWAEPPVSDAGVAPAFKANVSGVRQVWFDEAGELPQSNLLALQSRINKAAYDYSMPSRWLIGASSPADFRSNTKSSITNERSRPMGLTKNHDYETAGRVARGLHLEPVVGISREDATAFVYCADGRADGIFVSPSDAVPLALNVLGYDRPSAEYGAAGPTSYNRQTANRAIPYSQGDRDRQVAEAIDLLIGADIYDQRQAAAKAADEKLAAERAAKKEAEAKLARDAKLAADLASASKRLRNLSECITDYGVTAYRADELADAAAKYKAAYEAHAS